METGDRRWRVAEFFAGAGLARLGFEATGLFDVVWANDIDQDKAALYRTRFGGWEDDHLDLRDVHLVEGRDIPDVDVAWASFPCTDLSLAGDREGLVGAESGTWWAFHRVLAELADQGRLPAVVGVENVVGLASSNGGQDLESVLESLESLGYTVDALVLDARWFLPQSRPRLFVVGVSGGRDLLDSGQEHAARPDWLVSRVQRMGVKTFAPDLPHPPHGPSDVSGWVDRLDSDDPAWWDTERMGRFMDELSEVQMGRLQGMVERPSLMWRTAYRRTRRGKTAWEVRADQVAGCLRTVRGGSSKQAVVEAGKGEVRVRWMSPREYARLMGAGDYPIAGFRPSQVYSGFGDAVAVPVVEWLARHHITPLLASG